MQARQALGTIRDFYGRYTPWISLGLGLLSRGLSRRGVDFAPKAVAIVALAWLLPALAGRWLRAPAEGAAESRVHRFLRTTSPAVTVLLYKNVLFFLVPVWFGSAHLGSINVLAPALLAGMAFFTCFARKYRELVLERARVRVAWTALVLFAALVPAAAVIAFTSPRTSIVISGFLAAALACAVQAPREMLRSRQALYRLAGTAILAALLLGLAAPVFPPVPIVCHDHQAGTAVANRELDGQARSFPRGTPRVYAWFAVTLPARYRQDIAFQWYRDGKKVGRPIPTAVAGGRKDGFRTWSYNTAPGPGAWRVDLLTDASQLIGRTSFQVEP